MKLIYTLALVMILSPVLQAQEFGASFSYRKLHSKQFDELIKTYNFSRPFLGKEQAFIKNGWGGQLSYLFKPAEHDKSYYFRSGILVGVSQFSSELETEFSSIEFVFRTVEVGYLLEYNYDRIDVAFMSLALSGMASQLHKEIDGETTTVDDEAISTIQWGALVEFSTGYNFPLSSKIVLSPYFGIAYAPYFSEGDSEMVINQTNSLVKKTYTHFFRWQAGIKLRLLNNKIK